MMNGGAKGSPEAGWVLLSQLACVVGEGLGLYENKCSCSHFFLFIQVVVLIFYLTDLGH